MASDDTKISPEHFDLLVSGTGLQEALIAGAAAQSGKSVLHIDHTSGYGSLWKAHTLDSLQEWASTHSSSSSTKEPLPSESRSAPQDNFDIYSNVSLVRVEDATLGSSREYNIDLAPKAAYCAGPLVAALVASGGHNYTEFKALKNRYLWKEGRLASLPASRSDIFATTELSLQHRRSITRFLTFVQGTDGESQQEVFDDRPFSELLKEQGVPHEVRQMLYALTLLDSDQEAPVQSDPQSASPEASRTAAANSRSTAVGCSSRAATAKEGLAAMKLHLESVSKFGLNSGALLLPCYGTAELPQTFCRVAAVAGALYVLRCPVDRLICHESSSAHRVTGVMTANGQHLTCNAFAGDISAFADSGARRVIPTSTSVSKVARVIAITNKSIEKVGDGKAAAVVTLPPHSLPSDNAAAVRVLQVGNDTSAAPAGRWLLYGSTEVAAALSDAAAASAAALTDVRVALEQLVQSIPSPSPSPSPAKPLGPLPAETGPDPAASPPSASKQGAVSASDDGRPAALLIVTYLQSTAGLQEGSLPCNAVCSTPPDGRLDFGNTLVEAAAAYQRLYPSEANVTGGLPFGCKAAAADKTDAGSRGEDPETLQEEQQVSTPSSSDDSDDDTLAALQTALQTLEVGK